MKISFDNKIVLITGGASGIGKAVCLAFAREGATVVMSDINDHAGTELSEKIVQSGQKSAFFEADVTDSTNVENLFKRIANEYGRLDIAINNVGIEGPCKRVGDYEIHEWQRVVNTNLNSVFYCMKHETAMMMKQSAGVIVNMSSIAGLIGFPSFAAYSATKHALIGLTKSAALEYVKQGIRINALCPGYVQTPIVKKMMRNEDMKKRLLSVIPARRIGTTREIAQTLLYMCSDEASYMIGNPLVIDGGIVAT